MLFNAVRFFEKSVQVKTNEDGSKTYSASSTALTNNKAFVFIYAIILSTLVLPVLPVVLLVTMNTQLIIEVRRIKRRADQTQNIPRQEDNITLVMITIILLLIVCHTPDTIVRIVGIFLPQEMHCGTTYYYAYNVSTLLVVCNSSVNFIVYYLMRRGFRKILVRRLCHCVKGTYSNTSAMFQTISYSAAKKKFATSKSCPEFSFDNNSVQSHEGVTLNEDARKVSVI